jgi:DNA-binding protein H-NS
MERSHVPKQNKLSTLGEYREALKTALITRNNLIKMAKDNYQKARKAATERYKKQLLGKPK